MKKLIGFLTLFVLLSACNSTKKIVTVENNLQQAYSAQQYAKALESYNQLVAINKSKKISTATSATLLAAKSAYYLENYDTATQLFAEVDKKDNEALYMEGMSYKKQSALQREYETWKKNLTLLEQSEYYQEALGRLYLLEVNFLQYAAANQLWAKLDKQDDVELMVAQLTVLDQLELKREALTLSNAILKLDSKNESALFYKGKYYYDKAEKLYQSEMDKYNRNPNYTTYAYLRRELKKVSSDFRSARDLFEKLHTVSPANRTYMSYLKNCYVRLEMKAEAAKMDKLLN